MCIYHLFLLYRYLKRPYLTAIGYENHNKKAWVEKMLLIDGKDRGFAVAVLNSHLSASTSLTSISLVLCSLIGALLGSSSNNFLTSRFILGDTSQSTSTIKYIAILSFFLLAFACFVQTTRHSVHGCFLISMPTGDVPADCIKKAVLRGSNFWTIGLRALYFAATLLLWIFGPIPMFVGSVATVIVLNFLDMNKDPMIQYGHNTSSDGGHLLKKIGPALTSVVESSEHNETMKDNKEMEETPKNSMLVVHESSTLGRASTSSDSDAALLYAILDDLFIDHDHATLNLLPTKEDTLLKRGKKYLKHPNLTAIGYENHNKKAWVEKMLLLDGKDRAFAVAVLNGHLSASTSLTSISLLLCSLIGALLGNSSKNFLTSRFILGDTSQSTSTIKYIAVLSCFLLAFACFVQATRHFVHGCFLISMPTGDVPLDCIQKEVLRGSNFWTIGLRALYFAATLILWIFGPIPMLAGSVAIVMVLYFLDINKDPMIQYRHNTSGNDGRFLKNIGQKLTSVIESFEHNERQ
ncbi:hypothetical protein L1987_02327 [Smallanthus sonchifolius]|uniref:Uncharacterized protein n=1 Tax=Smallanthus sonchifolius TaxID=185202 RepID=A0ACB9K7Q2_9ASTR|nr:hypothetical protein L1987_02327 [Smallanthus sonchifolius]